MTHVEDAEIQDVKRASELILRNLETVVFGKRAKLELVLTCMFAEGHLLLEDVPGTAKTLLAKALARTFGGDFRRLQCTPDLLPGDITGVNVFNQKTAEFTFHPGPVVTQILLADEINRATPRAQAALLECMAERQFSVENKTWNLKRPFFVVATQNPVEHEGTFPLPEAQLDRFLMRLSLGYPSLEAEEKMLVEGDRGNPLDKLKKVMNLETLVKIQDMVRKVHVAPELRKYLLHAVTATRGSSDLVLGAGPRASQGLYRASQAMAAMAGRKYVTPDDIKRLFPSIIYHRVILGPEGRLSKRGAGQTVDQLLKLVPVPLMDPMLAQ